MSKFSTQSNHFKINALCLITLLSILSVTVAHAEDDAIYDDKEILMPSAVPGKEAGTAQASTRGVLSDMFMWKIRATAMYGEGENNYNIPVLEAQENEIRRTGGWQRRNVHVPTRVYLAAGDEITLDVKGYPSFTTVCSAHTFANFDKAYGPSETNRMILQAHTSQVYKAATPGMLMFACVDLTNDMSSWSSLGQFVNISTSPSHKNSSLYIYGVTPPGDWPAIARTPDPSGHVYLFNGRTVMDFPASVASRHADENIDAMMQEHLIITTRYDQFNGLTFFAENPLDTISFSMYQASFNTCCMSRYYNGLIGINFGGNRIVSHWGDWHEYGHQNQLSWKWGQLTEISNNIFSLEACRMLTGNKIANFDRCHGNFGSFITSDPESVGRFLAMEGLPETPTDPSNKMLLLLGQLYISFPDWHAQLARDYRAAWAQGDNSDNFSTDQKKIDWFAINSSRIVGRDLRGFFDKWEFPYSAEARQAIIDLNLPNPIKPSVQHSVEWTIPAKTTIQGTIAVPDLKSFVGLVAYGKEEGPTSLQPVEGNYTKLTTLVVGTRRLPYPIVLRGTLRHGECPEEYPVHALRACPGNDHNVYWKLSYVPLDNLLTLPDDNYEGVLRLGIRAGSDYNWGGTLTVPIKLNVSKSQ